MLYVPIVIIGLIYAATVTPSTLALTLGGGILLAVAVSRFASAIVDMPVSFGAALNAIIMSGGLVAMVAFFSLGSMLSGHPVQAILLSGPLLLIAFILGFHLSLGARLAASIAIAVFSSLLSMALFLLIRWAASAA